MSYTKLNLIHTKIHFKFVINGLKPFYTNILNRLVGVWHHLFSQLKNDSKLQWKLFKYFIEIEIYGIRSFMTNWIKNIFAVNRWQCLKIDADMIHIKSKKNNNAQLYFWWIDAVAVDFGKNNLCKRGLPRMETKYIVKPRWRGTCFKAKWKWGGGTREGWIYWFDGGPSS